jgi:hypothetical protein
MKDWLKPGFLLPLALLFFFFAFPFPSFAAGSSSDGLDTILVSRVYIPPSLEEAAGSRVYLLELRQFAESLEDKLSSMLSSAGLFRLVERKGRAELELEQSIAEKSIAEINSDSNVVPPSLKMTGAKYIIFLKIEGFQDAVESRIGPGLDRGSHKRKLFASVSGRIVDTANAEVLFIIPVERAEREAGRKMTREGAEVLSQKDLLDLSGDLAGALTRGIIYYLRPPKILSISGNRILISRGQDVGFKAGDKVDIFSAEELKEDEGRMVKKEVFAGKAVIFRSDASSSYADLSAENPKVKAGCLVRPETNAAGAPWYKIPPGSDEKPLKWNK